jgi:hypothetical protein
LKKTVLIAAVVLMAACQHKEKPPDTTVVWHLIGEWSGHGSVQTQTESFDIETGDVRVRWRANNEKTPGKGRLSVEVHSAVSGRLLDTPVENKGVGEDVAYVGIDPHWSYLLIDSTGVDWSVSVEEPLEMIRKGGSKN